MKHGDTMSSDFKGKILVVDDEKPITKLLSRILVNAGYYCQTAHNTTAAKEKLAAESFDLLISDLMMPGESGISLIKHAKEHYPNIGRIMATAIGTQDVAQEIMEIGVYGYIVKPISSEIVLITVANSLRHLTLDLHMKACVAEMKTSISQRTEKLKAIMDNLNIGIMMIDRDMNVLEMNKKMYSWYPEAADARGQKCYQILIDPDRKEICDDCIKDETFINGKTYEIEKVIMTHQGKRDSRIVTSPVSDHSGYVYAAIVSYEDMTERNMIARDLQQAQKLEAVGQLAAGIAHEINTPIQYIGDNLSFLKDSFVDLTNVIKEYAIGWKKLTQGEEKHETIEKKLHDVHKEADLDFLLDEIPVTIEQSLEGVGRVNKIVKAMKEFSHPGGEDKTVTDINKLLETTLTVCRNEWKYVAEMETDYAAELPAVPCYPGDISQVFLNIIVNGAHAIAALTKNGAEGMGKIFVRTRSTKDNVEIEITDTGAGIPEEVRDRIFEPFFTTKERGKGTGQGLAIANRVIEKKHHGKLTFTTEMGKGTTFTIKLPISIPE